MFMNRPAANNGNSASTLQKETIIAEASDKGTSVSEDVYYIRERVQRKLLADTDGDINRSHLPQMRQMIETVFNQVLSEENLLYTRSSRNRLLEWVISDILGYGPLEPLLQDPSITEVMVNGAKTIYIERHGLIELTEVTFENEAHLMRIIDRIVSPLGRRIDAGLTDGRCSFAQWFPGQRND